jgi:hypothetical protein
MQKAAVDSDISFYFAGFYISAKLPEMNAEIEKAPHFVTSVTFFDWLGVGRRPAN